MMKNSKEGTNEKITTPEGTRDAGISLPLWQVLTFGIPIVLAVAGGVFKLTMFSTQQHVNALQTELEVTKSRPTTVSEFTSDIPVRLPLPDVTRKTARDANAVDELARKLSVVEQERDTLIQELSQKALGSLDPNSELPVLLSQLRSNEQEVRGQAITGLFALKDRRSFPHLVAYFKTHVEEATRRGDRSTGEWYNLFIDLDRRAGIETVVEELDRKDFIYSHIAYETLDRRIDTVDLIETAKPCLESFALRSQNSFARTRAKVLLNSLPQRKSDLIKKAESEKADAERAKADSDKRSSREILLRAYPNNPAQRYVMMAQTR